MDYDSQFIVTLPATFPNIKTLDWCDDSVIDTSKEHPVIQYNRSIFKAMVQSWINLESIDDYSNLDLTKHLLETATCTQLTSIDISFVYDLTTLPITRYQMISLIASVGDAPSLERIVLRDVSIILADMENLYTNAPNLKYVKLYHIGIGFETLRSLVDLNTAESITSFSLTATRDETLGEAGEQSTDFALNAWISYVGNKYNRLTDLRLPIDHYGGIFVRNEESLSASLVSTLGNLKHLTNYADNLIPPSQQALDALNENGIQLEHLITAAIDNHIEETFNAVATASSTSTLSSLNVECIGSRCLVVSLGLIPLGRRLNFLTHLSINVGYAANTVILFVKILQNLDSLESLEFYSVDIGNWITGENEVHDDSFYREISEINHCRIKSLCFCTNFDARGAQDIYKKSNNLLEFTLLSCPNLEMFDLHVSSPAASGALSLDF